VLPCTLQPEFDKKYKVIVKYKYHSEYISIMDWLNNNSNGSVDIKIIEGQGYTMYVGFTDESDALFFKIKYSI
jgi:hypothetical protein